MRPGTFPGRSQAREVTVSSCYEQAANRGFAYIDNETMPRVRGRVVLGAYTRTADDRLDPDAERLWVGYDHERRAFLVEQGRP